ncbi:MAG: hypothetical protein GY841_19280 [FCB group bacterium]|nr:hypothetical protein [FCB group bacterium]
MTNLSKPIRIFVVIGLFCVLFIPIDVLWGKLRPGYSRVITPVAEFTANLIEFSDISYVMKTVDDNFSVDAQLTIGRQFYNKEGRRPADLVTYNLVLWAALFLSTFFFIDSRARLKFLIIAPIVLILWHLCDLTIFAKNAHWMLKQNLNQNYRGMIEYSHSWQWFWWWAFELNQKIIDPLLPILLWVIFCFRSFFSPSIRKKTENPAAAKG